MMPVNYRQVRKNNNLETLFAFDFQLFGAISFVSVLDEMKYSPFTMKSLTLARLLIREQAVLNSL